LNAWIKDLRQMSLEDFKNNYRDWNFFHQKLKERWIVYKSGTWLVDQVLHKHKLTIIELNPKTAAAILDMYDQQGSNQAR